MLKLVVRRYYMGISNCCALVGYGNDSNPIYNAIKPSRAGEQQDQTMTGSGSDEAAVKEFEDVLRFVNRIHDVILRRFGDHNVLTYVHTLLVFVYHNTFFPDAMTHLAPSFPWKLTALMLNTVIGSCHSYSRFESERFPKPEKDDAPRPLPEDYAMRGLLWAEKYYPAEWFTNDKIEDDEKGLEAASMGEERMVRVLYLGYRIARENKWLRYDEKEHQFSVSPEFDMEVDAVHVASAESVDFGTLPDACSDNLIVQHN